MFSVSGMRVTPSYEFGFNLRIPLLYFREFSIEGNHGVEPFVWELVYFPGRYNCRAVGLIDVSSQHDLLQYRVFYRAPLCHAQESAG